MDPDVAAVMGEWLRRARQRLRKLQSGVAREAGVSQSMISRMELGHGGAVPLATWVKVADVVGLDVMIDTRTAPALAAERVMRRCHQLVVDLAVKGEWSAWTRIDAADLAASETILRCMARQEVAVVRVWDVIADVREAVASFDRRLESERHERGPDWRVSGFVVIPATGSNRRRLSESVPAFVKAFPARAADWLIALGWPPPRPRPMPAKPAMIWTSESMDRLRPMLPYLDRRWRNRRRRTGRAKLRSPIPARCTACRFPRGCP